MPDRAAFFRSSKVEERKTRRTRGHGGEPEHLREVLKIVPPTPETHPLGSARGSTHEMKRTSTRLLILAYLALLGVGARALRPSASASAPSPPTVRTDTGEALRRARLEHDLIRAEKTAVLLGELAAVREVSE